MKNDNMYKVKVVSVTGLSKDTRSIRMIFADLAAAKDFSFEPGQFVMLGVLGFGEAALTITTTVRELPEFEVAVRSVGVATQAMHRLKPGDILYMRGPLGNSIITKEMYGHPLIVVAGGLGLAPLRPLVRMIAEDSSIVSSLDIVYGAKTPEDLLYKAELLDWANMANVQLIVDRADRAWTGPTGRVTELISKMEKQRDAVAIVCGPPIMYDGVAKSLLKLGLAEENIWFMLERRMKCGIGKCQHCTCGGRYVCIDGPTFSWKEIKNNWEAVR